MPPSEDSPRRLIVEGADDQFSVINLVARHGIDTKSNDATYVDDSDNMNELLRRIPEEIKGGAYQRLGFVVDGNADPAKRWREVRKAANAAEFELPEEMPRDGFIGPGDRAGTLIGVWLMPDNGSPGALEEFLTTLVPESDPCWPYAKEVVVAAKKKGARYKDKEIRKANIHTWLAWQSPPGFPYGKAIAAEYFGQKSELAKRFVAWYKRLFFE